ncbi:MAG TPA: phosphatase PAP2 family protein [Gemmatimonadaceae bacterium]|nr:phosphatase PAP2 family protein [Gemmatimonadaceae bacterium]
MHLRLFLALVLALLAARAASAQSVGRMVVDDVKWVAQDVAAIWLSPFRGDAGDYALTAGILAGSAALSVVDDNVDRWALAHRDEGLLKAIGPVRRGGDLYTLNKAVPIVGGAYVLALATKNRGVRDGIMGCAASYTAGTTLRHLVVYNVIGRDRPDTVRNHPAGETSPPARDGDQYHFSVPAHGWKDHSFPGGHVATVATCASFLMNRYDAPYIDLPLVALVGAMGIGRIADRGHWLSDQVLGIAMGWAIGKEVARRQLRRLSDERGPQPRASSGGALLGPSENGVLLGWQLTF